MAKTSTNNNTDDKPRSDKFSESTKPYYRDKLREHDRLKRRYDSHQKNITSEKYRCNNIKKKKEEPNSGSIRKNHTKTEHSTPAYAIPNNQTAHMLQIPTQMIFIPVPVFNYPRPYIQPMPYMMPRPFHVHQMTSPRVPGMPYNIRFPYYRPY